MHLTHDVSYRQRHFYRHLHNCTDNKRSGHFHSTFHAQFLRLFFQFLPIYSARTILQIYHLFHEYNLRLDQNFPLHTDLYVPNPINWQRISNPLVFDKHPTPFFLQPHQQHWMLAQNAQHHASHFGNRVPIYDIWPKSPNCQTA